ncbi:MAG: IPT/TIG domain-containing protein [Marinilabiliaceae bacterium]|nr:IPT/TIG domain-containing protein [Marinilabiliaceae bacterium]
MNKLLLLAGALVLIFCVTCQKEVVESREYPRISTLEVTDVSAEGATFYAEILSSGTTAITEYGFIWDTIPVLNYDHSEKMVRKETLSKKKFNCRINASLIKDRSYFLKAFVRTKDYLVFGEAVTFVSNGSIPPKIYSFSPHTGHWGDTVSIKGERFSFKSNEVKFGQLKAHVAFNSDSLIKVIVPAEVNDAQVRIFIKTYDSSSGTKDSFHYLQPQLESFYPTLITFNDTVVIRGKNFNPHRTNTSVKLDSRDVPIAFLSDSLMKFVVPTNIMNSTSLLSVKSEGVTTVAERSLNLKPFRFDEAKTDTIHDLSDDIFITIHGEGFNPEIKYNNLFIDDIKVDILESTPTTLYFKFPDNWTFDLNYTFEKRFTVALKIADRTQNSSNLFVLKNQGRWAWKRKASFPGGGRGYAVSFVLNGKAYVGTGFDGTNHYSDFYEYDPAINSWRQIANLPGGGRAAASACVVDGVAYVGLGTSELEAYKDISGDLKKDWYKYDPIANNWIQMSDFNGLPRRSASVFSINNDIYINGGFVPQDGSSTQGIGKIVDLWKYDTASDHWTQLQTPDINYYYAQGLSIEGNGYIFSKDEIFKYDGNEWSMNKTGYVGYEYGVTYCSDKVYFVLPECHQVRGTRSVYSVDMEDYSMEEIYFPGSSRSMPSTFTIGNSIFSVLGRTFSSSRWEYYYLNDMYELEISE